MVLPFGDEWGAATVGPVPPVPLPDPPLTTDRLRLRPWRPTDLPALFAAFRDPAITRFSWPSADPYTEADARSYLQAQRRSRRRGEGLELAMVAPIDGTLLGCASLHGIDRPTGRASVGYWVAAPARGHRHAATATALLCAWAFDRLGLARLELTCEPANTASQRVAERLGFTREAVLRSHLPFKGGRRDSVLFSLLPDDLPAARSI